MAKTMDFGLFDTWNAVYAGGTMPWDPKFNGGEMLESEAYTKNFEQVDFIESMGWDYIWLGGGHFSTQASMDPQVLMLAAVIAARTKNLRIGSSIHRPLMKLAGEELS